MGPHRAGQAGVVATMSAKIRLAFYKGLREENPNSRIGDWAICLVTDHWSSHVELLVSSGPAPLGTQVDGQPYAGPTAWMLSSSLRDGGVREAWRALVPGRWVVVEFDGDPTGAIAGVRSRIGTPYDWFGLAAFLLPWRVSTRLMDFCSEVLAMFLGLPRPWHTSPGDLFRWAAKQPGFRVLDNHEMYLPWSAHAA